MRALPMMTSGLTSLREDRARHKSLTQWEDDGGRVLESLRRSGQDRRPALHRALRNQQQLEELPDLRRAGESLTFAMRSHLPTLAT
jgi:hypothetical protein